MGWARPHLFEGITLDEQTRRELERLDHPACGPQSSMDEARAERERDYDDAPAGRP